MSTDFWSSDLKKAEGLLQVIENLFGKSRSTRDSFSGQEVALTRGRLSQLTSLLTHLQQSLSVQTANGSLEEEGAIELKRRSMALAKLSRDVEQCQRRFYQAVSGKADQDVESQTSSGVSTRDEDQVMMQERSSQLDHILGTATNLKEIGYEINDEIGMHVRLLEEIESREDEIFSKQKQSERQLKEWMSSKGGNIAWLWGTVVVLFLTFIYVLMW